MTRFEPRLDILPGAQLSVWEELSRSAPADFVLYGGTSIALRLGHRTSVDFDFFSSEPFRPGELQRQITWIREAEVLQSSPNTLTVVLKRGEPVKISFFGGLSFGRVGDPELAGESALSCASLLDLGATKLKVLHDRAESKDYLDLAALLNNGVELVRMLGAAQALYGDAFNPMIALKALTYFEDGDLPRLPDHIKASLRRAASGAAGVKQVPLASKKIGQ